MMERKKILIWGSSAKGEEVYQLLNEHRGYEVIAFGDNNAELWNKSIFQKPVIGSMDLADFHGLDCIVIASKHSQKIKEQLSSIVDVPVYISLEDLMYKRIAIDISGGCNAKCKWCVTGQKNRKNQQRASHFMRYDEFVRLYEHLYQHAIIEKTTEIMLYNWGEPLLNKDYVSIVEFLADREQKFSVSTNASIVQYAKRKDSYKNCCSFIFSMPGFSQSSYERIHGFSFERIKKNIEELNANLKEYGFKGDGSISYHVYQFNLNEIKFAEEFAHSLGLRFSPYYPYFNGNSMAQDYLEDRLDNKMKTEAEQELYLSHVKSLLSKRPENYRCFLENIISIDDYGDLVLCCASDNGCVDYKWGSVFGIFSFSEMRRMRQKMLACNTCQKCRSLGIDYWMEYNPVYIIQEESKN